MSDRIRTALEAFVRQVFSRVDYLALYPAKVVVQQVDGSVDLKPDDTRVAGPGVSRVKLRLGLPGASVKVPPGSRVLLGFEGGDPAKPYAALFDAGQQLELVFTAATKVVIDAPAIFLGGEAGVPGPRKVVCYGDDITWVPGPAVGPLLPNPATAALIVARKTSAQ